MFDDFAMGDLKSQIQQHLLMVEEVLGGMDINLRALDKRLGRIEELLGVSPEGWPHPAASQMLNVSRVSCQEFVSCSGNYGKFKFGVPRVEASS